MNESFAGSVEAVDDRLAPMAEWERQMKAGTIRTRKVSAVSPDDTVESAAMLMARINAGILPVLSGRRVVGLLTDRDIVVRAVAAGKPVASCTVDEVMTEEVHYCLEDDAVEDVAKHGGARRQAHARPRQRQRPGRPRFSR